MGYARRASVSAMILLLATPVEAANCLVYLSADAAYHDAVRNATATRNAARSKARATCHQANAEAERLYREVTDKNFRDYRAYVDSLGSSLGRSFKEQDAHKRKIAHANSVLAEANDESRREIFAAAATKCDKARAVATVSNPDSPIAAAIRKAEAALIDAYVAAYANPGGGVRSIEGYDKAIVYKVARDERREFCPK